MSLRPVSGSICAPKGFKAAGGTAGIKDSGSPDLALIVSDSLAAGAGVFTTNRGAAASVQVSRSRVPSDAVRGVIVNSGCANSFTGKQGYEDAFEMGALAARALGCAEEAILVCSTGHIGSYLPMEKLRSSIPSLAPELQVNDEKAMNAILTTDTRPKFSSVSHSQGWSVGGICKGAAMIAPNMATMLAFLTTDAKVSSGILQSVLGEVVQTTFNSIIVDGDTSTNDTVLAFANGASGVEPDLEEFASALHMVCRSLAEQIVLDGEGATKFIRIRVRGARQEEDARVAARAIAESPLVKTAFFGNDPNWGRIAAAIGKTQVDFDIEKLTISIDGHAVLNEGVPAPDAVTKARTSLVTNPEPSVVCDLFAGDETWEVMTTDLSQEYVRLNAEYET